MLVFGQIGSWLKSGGASGARTSFGTAVGESMGITGKEWFVGSDGLLAEIS